MKSSLNFAVLVVLSLAAASTAALHVEVDAKEQFYAFVGRFNKKYANDNEYQQRLAAFTHNLAQIEAFNAKYGEKTQFGITQFSDMTPTEFKERVLMKKPGFPVGQGTQASPSPFPTPVVIPKTFDWRNKTGILTPVYDQGDCGSGWAFSVAENLESLWAIAGHGCDGGISNEGFEVWITIRLGLLVRPSFTVTHHNRYYQSIMNAGGLESAASYPYTAKTDRCSFNSSDIAAKIWGYMLVTRFGSEPIMTGFLSYLSPITGCGTEFNHCLLAVGYNLEANPPYWILRNSWGDKWGMKGYMYLEFGKDACGVAQKSFSGLNF
ncbi:papain family cysteine protease subfamily protein [Acanthamoeba castellanii str. Neff]|uniref:Papain family cysteine protease subfamily protein n=1 Tax=Acanthamoeba castellanii (strain ATCC 30010 / Neff) TaxID=1257118 RepID=L8GM49_ACACF|nr:papain family cysteine protease subfamily protein [Acanthamoeba castellanii str. Neff]ELR14120.1 papain family cysteine protease subfamily protein [Acanthamoeba castellanii str. Neff]